jgi:hypothetical protein
MDKKYVFAESFNSAHHKKDWVRKPQFREVPQLGKVRKPIKSFKYENLQICVLRNVCISGPPTFADKQQRQNAINNRGVATEGRPAQQNTQEHHGQATTGVLITEWRSATTA